MGKNKSRRSFTTRTLSTFGALFIGSKIQGAKKVNEKDHGYVKSETSRGKRKFIPGILYNYCISGEMYLHLKYWRKHLHHSSYHNSVTSGIIAGALFFIFICLSPSIAQEQNGLSVKSLAEEGFSIYSSESHDQVHIKDLAEWEQHRWKLKRNMEAVMGPLPDRQNLPEMDIRIKDSLRTEKYTRLNIDFLAAEGERVTAYIYIPHRSAIKGKSPAILALHPTGMEGKKIVDGQGKENRGYAKELAERGYIVIAPDYPSFGDLADYDFKEDRYLSGTMAGIFYHMRCVDLLTARDDVDPERIGVIGHSLGGHNAIFVAAFDERLKVIVTSCGWTQMEYYDIGPAASEHYGGRLGPYAQDRYMPLYREKFNLDGDLVPINYHEMIALLAPRPFFSNSPLNDSNFDVKGVIKGMTMVSEVYQWMNVQEHLQVRYPEAEHDFPTTVRSESYQFIDKMLGHTPGNHEME